MKKLAIAIAVSAVALIGGSTANAADNTVKAKAATDVSQSTDFSSRHRYRRSYRIQRYYTQGYARPYYGSYGYAPQSYYYGGGPSIGFGFGGGHGGGFGGGHGGGFGGGHGGGRH